MKISIAWLFDHIDAPWHTVDIEKLVTLFNKKTAEIEEWHKVTVDLKNISCARVTEMNINTITVESAEWNIKALLPPRKNLNYDDWFLITKHDNEYRWTTMRDLGSAKDGLVPSVHLEESQYAGEWKQECEVTDYILEVDNKSITHRPDMWGHRGFAREVAALLNLPLKPIDSFVHPHKIGTADNSAKVDSLSIIIDDTVNCKRFAGLEVSSIENRSSLLWMALRLARVDSKPINALVDFTNYVMLDLSQPMHAFDANLLSDKKISICKARNKEKLTLLDGETIELTSNDLVVCDNKKPIALAGVMGGKETEINKTTSALLLESANFDATTIRLSATLHKKRTEASARFEKSLDPNQNITAIERFLKLCDNAHIKYEAHNNMISLGAPLQPLDIPIAHEFIEKRLGTTVDSAFVRDTLTALGFFVEESNSNNTISYIVTVPSFRCSKDVRIKEDILEEIGRFFGYDTIPTTMPYLQLTPSDTDGIMRERTIKNSLAFSGNMREVYTYSFFDESFLQELKWQPENPVTIKNPVSQNWQKMVTSLVPHLIKTVALNAPDHDQLRFFESARTWHQTKDIVEKKSVAGILFDKKNAIDFYDAKTILTTLFKTLRMPITWERVDSPEMPWFAPHQTARLILNGNSIGMAGMANHSFLNSVSEGTAFIFELDGDALMNYQPDTIHVTSPSKYPEVVRDLSILVPLNYTTDALANLIAQTDSRITNVTLIDFFQKKEWENQKSLTMRFVLCDRNKTLSSDEVDTVYNTVVDKLETLGATIR